MINVAASGTNFFSEGEDGDAEMTCLLPNISSYKMDNFDANCKPVTDGSAEREVVTEVLGQAEKRKTDPSIHWNAQNAEIPISSKGENIFEGKIGVE